MKRLLFLFVLLSLAAVPVQAGVSVSFHAGGYYGGYHGCSGGSYGYHGYYGGGYGGYYGGYPAYGYVSYGYLPDDDYSPVVYTSPVSTSPVVYNTTSTTPVYPYAPQVAAPSNPAPATTANATPAATASMATGKVDESGFIHSPYTTAMFKADKIAPGQVFYDPITGQPFTVQLPATPPAAKPAPSASLPAGKLDEFGYAHSPFSTFTFKVQNGNYAQVFRDPYTGQSFVVQPKEAPQPAVHTMASAQASN